MSSLEEHEDLIEVPFLIDENKGILYKLCVTEFRDKNYLSIRQWYLNFEGEWAPTKNGFTTLYTLDTVSALFNGLAELLSKAEVLETVLQHTRSDENIT